MSDKRYRMLKPIKAAAIILAKLAIAILAGGLVALWAVPFAYQERGYWSIGGEALIILSAFGGTLWLIHRVTQFRREVQRHAKMVQAGRTGQMQTMRKGH